MKRKLNIIGINGSASKNSSNLAILKYIAKIEKENIKLNILADLSEIPHFDTTLTDTNTPKEVENLRKLINHSDGVIICAPEYVFSIPSRLKNVIEWCVSTVVFSNKPVGLITASASGKKAHEELQLLMNTIEAKLNDNCTLLIQGIKGKVDANGKITNQDTQIDLTNFTKYFKELINN
ncbi:MAG: NADPH-dependent FMN reductase [Vicingaceae bacterium]